VLRPDVYFEQMSSKVYAWCIRQQRYELAAETVKCKPGLTTSNQSARLSDRDKASLAIAYQHLRKFTEALELLETLPRNPLDVPGQSKMVIPGELIAECQKELGTGGEKDAGQFQLAGPFAHLDYFADFATDEQGLWIASGQWLSQVSYSFHTNVHLPLPLTPSAVVMAICDSPDKLWVGCMRGGGLVEYDKKLRTCLHLGVKEGLLAEDIGSLHLQGERLWIGYYCGLGRMDLTSRQCAAFTPSLIENGIAPNWRGNQVKGSEQGPPIVTISGINASPEGVLWVLPQQPPLRVRRFRQKENQWDAVPDLIYCCSLASDGTHVFVGHDNLRWTSSTDKGKYRAGVTVANWDGTVSRTITKADGLPSDVVTTLTVDGSDLWIGGKGFVSVFDLRQGKIRKTSLVRTEKIKRIQIGGGFVWAQYDRHIYRASLADTL
jgi:hypothetical protein